MWALAGCALVVGCAGSGAATPGAQRPHPPVVTAVSVSEARDPVRLVFVGDVMLGRGVASVVAGDPSSVFERLRPMLVEADLAFANLESPLTLRTHERGEFALEADPAGAALLAGAGFDLLDLANNHATDAGPGTVLDTANALESVGLLGVGAGGNSSDAAAARVIDVDGVRVGVIAFDLAGGQPATSDAAGVNVWEPESARVAITHLRESVDIVIVGLHGGVEYLPRPDPVLDHVVDLAAEWGADVVWGHGAHVPYPVDVRVSSSGTAVTAPGLGNALFDQGLPGTQVGAALEVLVDRDGVLAMRTGSVAIDSGRSSFLGWDQPTGDAVALGGDWWTPVRPWSPAAAAPPAAVAVPADVDLALPPEHVEVARSSGDITGTGEIDVVVAYRRPVRSEPAHDLFPEVRWSDEHGRSAHVAVFTDTGRMRWGSAVLFQPIGQVAVCDGAMAVGFTTMDDPAIVSGGAWLWDGFGFRTAALLPGSASATCADIDHDGRSEPVLTRRSTLATSRDREESS
jgi:poly-gamma-glutamate capsule biosynthesis protein CapA/YwtB (metallophosphatase superfamily)